MLNQQRRIEAAIMPVAVRLKITIANRPERMMMRCLFDSLSLSRHGKSSGELSSVMILNPMTGSSLEKAMSRYSKTSHE